MTEDAEAGAEVALTAYVCLITVVPLFNYLGRVLLDSYGNWPEVIWNLRKSQDKWARLLRVIVREGEDVRMSRLFCTAVVQAVLL